MLNLWLDHHRLPTKALQQTSRAREREPNKQPVERFSSHKQRRRGGDPKTEALEAIHQRAGKTAPEAKAQSNDNIRRPVFKSQQMSYPPGGKNRYRKSEPKFRFAHSAAGGAVIPAKANPVPWR